MKASTDFFSEEALWLASEIKAFALAANLTPARAGTLEKIVQRLAQAVCVDKKTALEIKDSEEADFLKSLPENLVETASCRSNTPATAAPNFAPLVFDASRSPARPKLYFRRHFLQEIFIEEFFENLAKSPPKTTLNCEKLITAGTLDGFPFALNAEQQNAVRKILSQKFTLISGGPGTGKTTLLLRAIICFLKQNPAAKIAIAAPTGKAAGRIQESIAAQLKNISGADFCRKTLDALNAKTLHRLLGLGHKNNTPKMLDADVVIADEASMISQALMFSLLRALRQDAKLILLGDKNQLDSVDAGHVFGDICVAPMLAGTHAELKESLRFNEKNFHGKLANAVLSGDATGTLSLLKNAETNENLHCEPCGEKIAGTRLEAVITSIFPPILNNPPANASPESLLEAIETSRILSPARTGTLGTENLNALARRIFSQGRAGTHFHGEPVMILKNDYTQNLFNGDIGIILQDAAGTLRAWFRGEAETGETLRNFPLALLPEHETAYVMTIHKSQGSEFSRLAVFLPEIAHTDFLSRQLLYTALTRFLELPKSRFFFFYSGKSLRACLAQNTTAGTLFREQ